MANKTACKFVRPFDEDSFLRKKSVSYSIYKLSKVRSKCFIFLQTILLILNIVRWTYTEESIRSGMAVLDVAIPTGYWVQQQKLDAYVISRRVRNLQRAKYEKKKVLFYFDYVSLNFTQIINLKIT